VATLRKTILANDQFYHIFNRGVEKRDIFTDKREYKRALGTLKYYQYRNLAIKFSKFLVQTPQNQEKILTQIVKPGNKLVDIVSFCLMPNHFHFLIKQLSDNGISTFIANFTNSYTKYFNTKHDWNGSLIQGPFKSVYIESNEQLIHLSRYIHLNPVTSYIIKEKGLESYPWSSLKEYLESEEAFCQKEIITKQFHSVNDYKNFVFDQISYSQELDKIKHLIIEE